MKASIVIATATMLLSAVPAGADILTTGTRVGNYSNTTSEAEVVVPINGTYSSVTFDTSTPNELVRITYNAECGALGDPGQWLAVIIKVDGIEASPASGTSFALCTATSTTTFSWTGAVRQSTIKVPHTGTHKVTVTGYGAGVTQWWLGDTSIVVDK